MWYVFGSLDPKNRTLPERAFALLAYVVMVIIDGAVAGVLSSVMIRMGGKEAQINEKIKAAKMWMREQRIPKDQASKALEYFRLVYKSRVMYEEADILNTCVTFTWCSIARACLQNTMADPASHLCT
jgi:hypothetical protein